MAFFPGDDDPSRARREQIIRYFQEHGDPNDTLRRVPRDQLMEFLKEHGMPLGDPEDAQYKRILSIGGRPQFVKQLRELLPKSEQFKIESALTGFEAGIQAESFLPHVIIIDFDVGFSEAFMLVQNLRKSSHYKATLIIGLANDSKQMSPDDVANRFSEMKQKPVDVAQLCHRIRAHFGFTP